jgi:hypothetical protein
VRRSEKSHAGWPRHAECLARWDEVVVLALGRRREQEVYLVATQRR